MKKTIKTDQQYSDINAQTFIEILYTYQSDKELEKIKRYFKRDEGDYGAGDIFIGVRMGEVFDLAKQFIAMPVDEIEILLESPIHEVRTGAVSIMDFQARSKKTPEAQRKAIFDLYLRRHDRINNWDLVDRAAIFVVGSYLFNKSRSVLYKLAHSKNIWERRTAIVSTGYFIRQKEVEDTFKIAEMLLKDEEDLIHKAAGGWIREAGKKDASKLTAFLDQYADTMPRTMLRYALEHLDKQQKDYYLAIKKNN